MTYNGATVANLLVVEDDDASREFFRFILENAGHRVRAVSDGQAALDAVAAEIPDLVLLDIMLPEVHGYEVCHRLKRGEKTARVKILFLSAKTFQADKHQASSVGADGYLSKPVEPAVLVEHVAALLKGPSPSAS